MRLNHKNTNLCNAHRQAGRPDAGAGCGERVGKGSREVVLSGKAVKKVWEPGRGG